MTLPTAFADVLEAAGKLDADAQAELVAVLQRRLAEQGRQRVVQTVEQSRREFAAGDCMPMSAEDMLRDAQS